MPMRVSLFPTQGQMDQILLLSLFHKPISSLLPVFFFERHTNYVLSKYGIDLADPAGEDIQPTLILTPEANNLSRAALPIGSRQETLY